MNAFRQLPTVQRTVFPPAMWLIHHRCRGIRRIGTACQKRLLYFVHKADGKENDHRCPVAARLASFSFSGTGVRPSMRVMMTVWLTVGSVYSAFSAAAAPQKLDTPGVSS